MSLWIKAAYSQFSPALQSLAAKSTQKNTLQWLPAWVHFADTANIIRKLVVTWLPASVVHAADSEMSQEDFLNLCTFLALTHDIGKLTGVSIGNIGTVSRIENTYRTLWFIIVRNEFLVISEQISPCFGRRSNFIRL